MIDLLCYYVCFIGVFYYILGNVRPMFRSRMQAIHLFALAKASDIRCFGYDSLIKPFIQQVNELGKVRVSCACVRLYNLCYCRTMATHWSCRMRRSFLEEQLWLSVGILQQVATYEALKKGWDFPSESVGVAW